MLKTPLEKIFNSGHLLTNTSTSDGNLMVCVENKKRESKQREEGENAERRGRETERREREGRD